KKSFYQYQMAHVENQFLKIPGIFRDSWANAKPHKYNPTNQPARTRHYPNHQNSTIYRKVLIDRPICPISSPICLRFPPPIPHPNSPSSPPTHLPYSRIKIVGKPTSNHLLNPKDACL